MAYELQAAHRGYQNALAAMAVDEANLRERLLLGYRGHARAVLTPSEGDVPKHLRARLVAFHERMTEAGTGPEGSIAKTVAAMTDDEVAEAAEELVAIARAIDEATW